MQVVENTPDRLVLRGVPGGRNEQVMLVIVGLGVPIGALAIGAPLLMAIPFTLVGVLIASFGADGFLKRETLEFDRTSGKGRYFRVHLLRRRGFHEDVGFLLSDVHSVRIERQIVEELDARIDRVRSIVRLSDPKRDLIVSESRTGRLRGARELVVCIADFLGVRFVEGLSLFGGVESLVETAEFTRRFIDRSHDLEPLADAPPPGSRIQITHDPTRNRRTLRWRHAGRRASYVWGLLLIGVPISFAAAFFGWAGVREVSGRPFSGSELGVEGGAIALVLSAAAFLFVVIPWILVILGATTRVTIDHDAIVVREPFIPWRWSIPVKSISTIRCHQYGDTVECYQGCRPRPISIDRPAPGEVEWLAEYMKRAMLR